jgi:hypothetical protein
MVRGRLFTVDEANALIPRLEIIMSRLQRQGLLFRDELRGLARETGQTTEEVSSTEILELRPQLRPVLEELDRLQEELDELGVHLKGLDLGLIDFPAEIDGEVVLLCWQFGEKELGYYHDIEAGFAGRKPLDHSVAQGRTLH